MFCRSKIRNVLAGSLQPEAICTSSCLNPRLTLVYDPVLSKSVWQNVRCGKCENCQNQYREEWVSRMCLHSLSWMYCYFITLTYGSYDLTVFDSHPFFEDWLLTYPVRDKYNKNHRYCYTPSILRPEHLTKFFKRLRKNTGAEISYCACGEYGSKYNESGSKQKGFGFGRPHFHAIIWSMSPLTKKDISDAWSYKCVALDKTFIVKDNGKFSNEYVHFRFPFGLVDFQDLVPELNWNGVPDSTGNNARKCFNYVAKYICKKDEICPAAVLRMKRTFVRLGLCDEYYNSNFIIPEHFEDRIDNYRKFTRNNINYEKINFKTFKQICAPFFVCSRKNAIGKRYCLQRMHDFTAGNFALPKFCGRDLEFPSYFHRLASLVSYPLRLVSVGEKSVSFIKGSLLYLRDAYADLAEIVSPFEFPEVCDVYSQKLRKLLNKGHHLELFKGRITDIVLCDPNKSNISYEYDDFLDVFNGYIFDRSAGQKVLYNSFPRVEFMQLLIDMINTEINRYHVNAVDLFREDENSVIDMIRKSSACSEIISNYKTVNAETQEKYAALHKIQNDNQ